MTIYFYFDFLSPFAYLANHGLKAIAVKHQCKVVYRAIDLAAAKSAIGNNGPTNREMPTKLGYLMKDLERWAARYDVPFRKVQNHNSQMLNIGTYFAEDRGQVADYVNAAYRRTWGEGGAPDSDALHKSLALELGWNPEEFIGFINSDTGMSRYKDSTQAAITKRVFGVPTMTIGEEMWWGNDRLMMVDEFLSNQK